MLRNRSAPGQSTARMPKLSGDLPPAAPATVEWPVSTARSSGTGRWDDTRPHRSTRLSCLAGHAAAHQQRSRLPSDVGRRRRTTRTVGLPLFCANSRWLPAAGPPPSPAIAGAKTSAFAYIKLRDIAHPVVATGSIPNSPHAPCPRFFVAWCFRGSLLYLCDLASFAVEPGFLCAPR